MAKLKLGTIEDDKPVKLALELKPSGFSKQGRAVLPCQFVIGPFLNQNRFRDKVAPCDGFFADEPMVYGQSGYQTLPIERHIRKLGSPCGSGYQTNIEMPLINCMQNIALLHFVEGKTHLRKTTSPTAQDVVKRSCDWGMHMPSRISPISPVPL